MDNNDILIRLRYALDLKDNQMVKIFDLGGIKLTIDEAKKILTKPEEGTDENNSYIRELDDIINCTNEMLDGFLNGLITYKRGKQEQRPGQPKTPPLMIEKDSQVNNILLKKLKIALKLTSDDMLDIFDKAGIDITKGELSAVLRKEGQRNYKVCGDRYVRNFLKGMAIKYR